MKPEEEIVTVRITRKEAERIAASRWMKPKMKAMMWWFMVGMGLAFILLLVDSVGMATGAHRLGKPAVYVAGVLYLAAFSWPYYLAAIKSDRIGKDEAKKLIV